MDLPQFTQEDYELKFSDRHMLQSVVAKWAQEKPDAPALIGADGARRVTWSEFDRVTTALAAELLRLGFRKGDYVVTFLALTLDHVLLEYSCFKIGAILAPLDLRLSPAEVVRAMELLRPRAFVWQAGGVPCGFASMARAVSAECPWLEHSIAVGSEEPVAGARSFGVMANAAWQAAAEGMTAADSAAVRAVAASLSVDDGALVIFTTGSTGSPKPALLSHRNITVQNMCLSGALLGGDLGVRTLVHLPPSHVGCQTELLMSTLYGGGAVVLLEVFDAARTLRVVEQHRVDFLGQIPAMYNLEWLLRDFDRYDLSSVRFAFFGGNAVSRPFVERVATMAPVIGTGLGLTESSGFCTYIKANSGEHQAVLDSLGQDMPIYPCTIREAMREDGAAGAELPRGGIGHVCFRGPQTFLGYVNDPESTAKAISTDGFLYTGDMGFRDEAGIHLTGRAKWVIKSLGYQVFPGDVEAHLAAFTEKVGNCVVVGVPHEVVGEAPVAVVEKKPDVELTAQELDRHARSLPSYMRPRHWILLEAGKMPLNRVVKPDYLRALEMAQQEIAQLRAQGEWDSSYVLD